MNARAENSPEFWTETWRNESRDTWRAEALKEVYDRICQLIPRDAAAIDLGGGIGLLAEQLVKSKGCKVSVWEQSQGILDMLPTGVDGAIVDLELELPVLDTPVIIATEVLEHLSEEARHRIWSASAHKVCFFSVPNDRLDETEEPQHTCKYNAVTYLRELRAHFEHVRVECFQGYLLAVCGYQKNFKLSVCFPAKDEAADIERTLASFRGVADELIVGVDPRTTDNTKEICLKYCDIVFDLTSPEGNGDDKCPPGGVHFSWIRNQCIDRCTGDWVFMTEAHEHLDRGVDTLLALDHIMPKKAQIGFTLRQGQGQQWAFPWLFKNGQGYKYKRRTHNILDYPDGAYVVRLPQVITIHDRSHANAVDRQQQRKVQNRKTLFEDWVINQNDQSLYYLGSEWREYDNQRAIRYLQQFLDVHSRNGEMRYQARLILAKTMMIEGDSKGARDVLLGCIGEDWSRTDHWIWLGDLAVEAQKFEEALQFYRYSTTMIGRVPFTIWWIDLANYSYLPAQRMAMTYGELGLNQEAYVWAKLVRKYLPTDAPQELIDEADYNIRIIEDNLGIENKSGE